MFISKKTKSNKDIPSHYYNTMFSDGGRRSDVAYGSFKIFNSEGVELGHRQLVYGNYTSNYAEYLTLCKGLQYCIDNKIDYVYTFVDSELVYMQVYNYKNCYKPDLLELRDTVRNLLDKFIFVELIRVDRNFVHAILGH